MALGNVPALVDLPPDTPDTLRPVLQAMIDVLRVRSGQSRNQLDRSPTLRELFGGNIAIPIGEYNGGRFFQAPAQSLAPGAEDLSDDGFYTAAPLPVGLEGTAVFKIAVLNWTGYDPLGVTHAEIWRSATDDLGAAIFLGTARGLAYQDQTTNGGDWYYWVRTKITRGGIEFYSAFNDTAGTFVAAAIDPQDLLDALLGVLGTDHLDAILNTRLDLIDTPTTGLVDQLLAEVAARTSAINSEVQTRSDAVANLQGQITTDVGELAQEVSDRQGDVVILQGQINDLAGTVASEIYVQATKPLPGIMGVADPIPSNARWYDDSDNNHPYIWACRDTTNASYKWTLSGTEWFLEAAAGGDPMLFATGVAADSVRVDDTTTLAPGTAGALAAGEFAWGLEPVGSAFQTLIVRLPADADASAKTTGNLNAYAWLDLADPRIGANDTAITNLESTVNDPATGVTATAGVVDTLETVVTNGVHGNLALAADVTALESTVDDPTTGVAATSTALGALDTRVGTAEGAITASASDITVLESAVATAQGDVTGNANAIGALGTRVTTSEGTIVAQASDITSLQSAVGAAQGDATANATAITGLDTRTTAAEGSLVAQASDLTLLETELRNTSPGNLIRFPNFVGMDDPDNHFTYLNGSAVNTTLVPGAAESGGPALQMNSNGQFQVGAMQVGKYGIPVAYNDVVYIRARVRVSADFNGSIGIGFRTFDSASAQGSYEWTQIDAGGLTHGAWQTLDQSAIMGDTDVALAVPFLTTRNNATVGNLQIAYWEASRTPFGADETATSSAFTGLDTRVSASEGAIVAQSSDITALQSAVSTAQGDATANAGAITGLDTRTAAVEGDLTAQASDITALEGRVDSVPDLPVWRVRLERAAENTDHFIEYADNSTVIRTDYDMGGSYLRSTYTNATPAASGGEAYRFDLPWEANDILYGRLIRVRVRCRQTDDGNSAVSMLATYYSNSGEGNSGNKTLVLPATWGWVDFTYAAPAFNPAAPSRDALTIRADSTGAGLSADIAEVEILIADATLEDVGSLGVRSALANLGSEKSIRVTENNAQATRLDSLESTVGDPATGVAATSTALGALDTRVGTAEGAITASASDITALESTVNDPINGVAATVTALDTLDTRVTATEDGVTANASSITALESGLTGGEENHIPDAGFESNDNTLYGSNQGIIQAVLSQFPRPLGGGGTYAMQMIDPGDFRRFFWFTWAEGWPIIRPEERWTFGFWAMNTDSADRAVQFPGPTNWGPHDDLSWIIPGNSGWTWYQAKFAYTGAQKVEGQFRFETGVSPGAFDFGGQIFIDDVVLVTGHWDLDGSEVFPENPIFSGKANATAVAGLTTRADATDDDISAQADDITELESVIQHRADGDNLCVEGNFEDGTVDFWVTYPGGIDPTVEAVAGQDFTQALKIYNRDQYQGVYIGYGPSILDVPVETGDVIRIGFWGNADDLVGYTNETTGYDRSLRVGVRYVDAAGVAGDIVFGDDTQVLLHSDVGWQFREFDVVVPPGARFFRPVVSIDGRNASQVASQPAGTGLLGSIRYTRDQVAKSSAFSGLSTQVTAAEDAIVVVADDLTTLNSLVIDPTTGLSAQATAASLLTTRVTNTEGVADAAAGSVSTLSTTVDGHTSTLSTYGSSIGGLEAKYGVELNVDGYITGFAQNNNGATGSFVIMADRFAIVDPGVSGPQTATVPFLVEDGVVYINDARIKTLGVEKLIDGTLNASVDVGTGRIVLNTGSHVKVIGVGFGANSNLVEWFGPTMAIAAMSTANSITHLTTAGDAYFGGSLSAGVLSNSGQTSDLGAAAEVEVGPFGSNGGGKQVTWSYTYSNNGRHASDLSGLTGTATVALFRKIGAAATFTQVATSQVVNGTVVLNNHTPGENQPNNYYHGFEMSGSFSFTDTDDLTLDRTYKMVIQSRTENFSFSLPDRTQRLFVISVEQ